MVHRWREAPQLPSARCVCRSACAGPTPRRPSRRRCRPCNAERVLVALALHAQQMSDRLERLEERLEDVAGSQLAIEPPTHDDLREVRTYSAAPLGGDGSDRAGAPGPHGRAGRSDAGRVVESRRQERARTLAETIIDLSDSLDTGTIDLRDNQDEWAATAPSPTRSRVNGHQPVYDAAAGTGRRRGGRCRDLRAGGHLGHVGHRHRRVGAVDGAHDLEGGPHPVAGEVDHGVATVPGVGVLDVGQGADDAPRRRRPARGRTATTPTCPPAPCRSGWWRRRPACGAGRRRPRRGCRR